MKAQPSIFGGPNAALDRARRLLASDPEAAVRQLVRLRADNPGNPRLLRLLGTGLRRLGRTAEAEAAEGEAIAASTRGPLHRQAAKAIAAGDPGRAEALLQSLLAEDETDVVALVMLGTLASNAGDIAAADRLLEKAVALAPADPPARLALARHLQSTRRSAEALAQLDQLKPDASASAASLSLRARTCKSLGRIEEEVELLRRLQAVEGPGKYQLRLGHALRSLGRGEEAVVAYRALLEHNPGDGSAWWSLANLKTARFTDRDIAVMKRGLADPAGTPLNRARLHFALGKAEEDRKRPADAYANYAEGNRVMAEASAYRPEAIGDWVSSAIGLFTPQFLAERAGQGSGARDPIFILGMQRSGSTLVEQMLAGHPLIEATAELDDLPKLVRDLTADARKAGRELAEHLARLSADELRGLGDSYIAATRIHRRQDRPFFTDKLPSNWLHAPLIRLILPNARIVDVRRHPLACGFSNWKQLYGSGLEHSYSMAWMGRYYADYVRLMRHLDAVQPGAVHRLIYERLVDDVEAEARRLLDYLGLPFDPAVLQFHAAGRTVRTISAEQVRQPINRQGLDQWRAFEQWLGPMKDALGEVLETWQQ